jgi:hypothetical protein
MDQKTNQPASEQKKQNTTNKILILIIALLTVFCGILVWQFIELNKAVKVEVAEKNEVTEEKDALSHELENMLKEYESLESDNTVLKSEIENQKQKIEQLMADVEKYKGNAAMMAKYKKETETLRKIMHSYVTTIDSLNTLNINLRKENTEVKVQLDVQAVKYQELNKEKENLNQKIEDASVLEAMNSYATGVLFKSSGKEVETNRAKKSEKIKVCFTLAENKIAKKGQRDVYVRIISPDAKILAEGADDSHMFTFNGVRGLFSAKRTIEYQNEPITGCAYFKVKDGEVLPEGKYLAEIFCEKEKIGSVSFDLK